MDNRQDIETICDVLEKEFRDMAMAIMPRDAGGPPQKRMSDDISKDRSRSIVEITRKASMTKVVDVEAELHTRVGYVEDTLRGLYSELDGLRDSLELLPLVCEKLGIDYEKLNKK